MKIGVLILLLLYVNTVRSEQCSVEFNEDHMEQRVIPRHQHNCLFSIKSKVNKAIKLEFILPENYKGNIYLRETFVQDGEVKSIFRSPVASSYISTVLPVFVSHGNGSFNFELDLNCADWDKAMPAFKHTRVKKYASRCDPIFQVIGTTITTVHSGYSNEREICAYRLVKDPLFTTAETKIYLVEESRYNEMSVYANGVKIPKNSILENATTDLQVLTNHKIDGHGPWIVQAVLSNETCSCATDFHLTSIVSNVTLRSPGYPNFACPNAICITTIYYDPIEVATGFVARVLVSIKSSARDEVTLRLSSGDMILKFDSETHDKGFFSFLLKPDDLSIIYTTPNLLTKVTNGHYEMNISRILVQNDCDCSTFMSRGHNSKWKGFASFPPHCDIVFCDWSIQYWSSKIMNITVENANEGDELQVWNNIPTKKYTGKQLNYTRSFKTREPSETHVFFWKKSKGENGKISLAWDAFEDNICNATHVVSTVPSTFSSPDFPLSMQNCSFTLVAPENHSITVYLYEVDVEPLHDHLSFYDGLTRLSKLIKHFSGKYEHETVNSTNNTMFIDFLSDMHRNLRGYHFEAFAVPIKDDSSSPSFIPILVFLAVISTIIALLAFFYKKCEKQSGSSNYFTNALIRFQTENNDSQPHVTISTT